MVLPRKQGHHAGVLPTRLNQPASSTSPWFPTSLRDVALGFLVATVFWTIPKTTNFISYKNWSSTRHGISQFFNYNHLDQKGHHHHWFPNADEIGYQGPTEAGVEPFLAAMAPISPTQISYFPLVSTAQLSSNHSFDPVRSWGYLSPFYSLPPGTFGLEESSGQIPSKCELEQVHLLHRHGSRYPTGSKFEPAGFFDRLKAVSNFKGKGNLEFLNTWEYGLGKEILTPFGQSQLYNLGVGFRQKYGYLLNKVNKKNKLVFRTTSQHRMLYSALNFAAGFFGFPFESKYHQSILIESKGFNNTLAPYQICKNSNEFSKTYAQDILTNWSQIYLKDTLPRLQVNLTGYQLTFEDIISMQQLCAYETVSLGWSSFCELFTPEEFKGFAYWSDLMFWYAYSFGSPYAAAIGKGWVQEFLSRLTRKPIKTYDSSTNSTLDSNPNTFPLDQPIYVDAAHDTVISCIVVALNLTSLASEGPLPTQYIPKKQSFVSSHISPSAGNLQVQVVNCQDAKKIRFLLNDAPIPLTGLDGCPDDPEGFCPLEISIEALQKRLEEIDYQHDCNSNYHYNPPFGGGGITNGRPSH